MSAIGKGDWLLSLETDDGEDGAHIDKGQVYCVRFVEDGSEWACWECGSEARIGLTTDPAHSKDGWCPCQFTPLGGNSLAQTRKAPQDVVTEWERKMVDA